MMKSLLALAPALLLAACADTSGPQSAYYTGPNLPYAAYSTTGVPTATNGAFAQWPTQQLQARRRELYSQIPRQIRHRVDRCRATPVDPRGDLLAAVGRLACLASHRLHLLSCQSD